MRFEKLNEDKIRITLDMKDLESKNIDYQAFMSNSISTQKLFLDMLEEAEKEIGFSTKDYKIMIEALATLDGTFVLTITRVAPKEEQQSKKMNLKVRRKVTQITQKQAIYSFACFDDFCNFCNLLDVSLRKNLDKLSKSFSLYTYQNTYYLVINNINLEFKSLKTFYSTILEFGKFVSDSKIIEGKLIEHGNLIIKDKAIKICLKHFLEK